VFPKLFAGYNQRIRIPGGFHLYNGPRNRDWKTPTGRANFLVCNGVAEDPEINDPAALRLTTIRSHDQYNTTGPSIDWGIMNRAIRSVGYIAGWGLVDGMDATFGWDRG
jgi:hypothetical protein